MEMLFALHNATNTFLSEMVISLAYTVSNSISENGVRNVGVVTDNMI